ncbi:WD40-repeat-containing domain protein [Pisolithus croceorrhizus]|nr:WD40-repeat-containing domain protein [Pisolithus croceorrhizus]KAI6094295.1 WD40-repeat-containing domain protein [Pisolithus sp. B1]
MSAYVVHKTLLNKHTDSVNALSFSPCRTYLVSGSSDWPICIWKVSSGRFIFCVVFDSQINALLWHLVKKDTLICSCKDGTVFYLSNFLPTGFARREIQLGVKDTPIFCLDLEPVMRLLVIGIGNEVHITQDKCLSNYTATTKLPHPQYKPQVDGGDCQIHPQSIHFYEGGKRLIVSYLNHGII